MGEVVSWSSIISSLDALGFFLSLVLGILFLAFQVWLIATLARRILGVPVGWPRSILVALVMSLALMGGVQFIVMGYTNQGSITDANVGPALLLATLATFWVFALGVAILMFLEILIPTGSLPSPISFFRDYKARRRRQARYFDIMKIAVRHGLVSQIRGLDKSRDSHRETAIALRETLNESGVTFVKLGQMLSTRSDLLPPVYIEELSQLQTNAAPESWEVIKQAIESSLGRPYSTAFSFIDETPLASASVAQVHTARTTHGDSVVIKVQRPSAVRQVQSDTDIVLRIAQWLEKSAPWARDLGIVGIARGFIDSLREELDYNVERNNMLAVAGALRKSDVRVPVVYDSLSSQRLLVMERLDGVPLGDAHHILRKMSPKERQDLARELIAATLKQITHDGVFHADLHPGNIFLSESGQPGLVDFGSVGRLDPSSQQALAMLLFAIDKNDNQAATDAMLILLDRPEQLNERAFERTLGQLMVRYRGGFGGAGSSEMFTALFALVVNHGFTVPPQIAAAFRALGALEGTLRLIDPSIDVVLLARDEGRKIATAQFGPKKIFEQAEMRFLQAIPAFSALPRRLNKISEDIEQGRLSFNVRMLAHPSDRGFLNRLVQQMVVAILAGSATLAAIVLITAETGPMLTDTIRVYGFIGYILLFMGFILALRSVVLVFHRDFRSDDERERY